MRYRLLHYLFGWHDWVWESPEDYHDTCSVCRARRDFEQ